MHILDHSNSFGKSRT